MDPNPTHLWLHIIYKLPFSLTEWAFVEESGISISMHSSLVTILLSSIPKVPKIYLSFILLPQSWTSTKVVISIQTSIFFVYHFPFHFSVKWWVCSSIKHKRDCIHWSMHYQSESYPQNKRGSPPFGRLSSRKRITYTLLSLKFRHSSGQRDSLLK